MSDLLTAAEHRLIDQLGECYSRYAASVVEYGPSRAGDLAEFAARIHDLQHAVMAQAAARAYPGLYRLAGSVTRTDPTDSAA